ncbi:MAG: DUF938 domain-containing protein [Hyphomonadaceae bacterium]
MARTDAPVSRRRRRTKAFDQSLQARDPRWGLRDVASVEAAANAEGLTLKEIIEMPANNLVLVFERQAMV